MVMHFKRYLSAGVFGLFGSPYSHLLPCVHFQFGMQLKDYRAGPPITSFCYTVEAMP